MAEVDASHVTNRDGYPVTIMNGQIMNAECEPESLGDEVAESRPALLWVIVALGLFTSLRMFYWHSIEEVPFSDMADYYSIAQKVWLSFSFDHNSFWRSYKPPGMPLIAAPVVGAFPGDVGLWLWRALVAAFTFVSAFLLSIQLTRLCGARWVGVAFLIIVSLSKSSIFWSYRFSTESLTEAATYGVLALYLWFVRNVRERGAWHAFFLGVACIALALIRPNMMPILAIVPVGVILRWLRGRPRLRSRMVVQVVALFAGIMMLWTPWLYRGASLYGELVPFSTQGPYSFLWEVGGFYYDDPELGRRNVNADILQAEAPTRFKTDKQAANLASLAGKQWLRQIGYENFTVLVFRRLSVMIQEREMTLSKTPRAVLLPSPIDGFLPDKSMEVVLCAVVGLLAGAFVFGLDFAVFGAVVVAPVFLSACFMGEPRMLEPMLPLISFAALIGVFLSIVFMTRSFRGLFVSSRRR